MKFEYTAEPTIARMHLSDAIVRYIEGPFGSGKTTGAIMELLRLSMEQQPDEHGVRYSRWAIIRNTYPELKSTTIKSFEAWVPHSVAPVVYSIPITSKFKQRLGDNTSVDIEFIFMALDSPEDVAKLLSLEISGAYINEGREVPVEIIDGLIGRMGRFPKTIKDEEGQTVYGCTRPCIIVDSNPPRNTHWLYTNFVNGDVHNTQVKLPDGREVNIKWERFIQPPAVYKDEVSGEWVLNPDAENLRNLDDLYYARQMTLGEEHIRVNLAGEYGMTRKGKPVFTKFSNFKHVAKQIIVPKRGTAVLLGIDFGLTPACVIDQLDFRGLRITDELPATDESLEDFVDHYILPLLRDKYNGYNIVACGDPAGGARSSINKMTSIGLMMTKGIKTYPAITNNFVKRKEAVDYFLGRDEGFLVSPQLTHVIEALGAGYVWKESRGSDGKVLDIANKNEFSHIADAIQYLCLYARYGGGSLSKPGSVGGIGAGSRSGSTGGAGRKKWA